LKKILFVPKTILAFLSWDVRRGFPLMLLLDFHFEEKAAATTTTTTTTTLEKKTFFIQFS
jgi:hypothetical protein